MNRWIYWLLTEYALPTLIVVIILAVITIYLNAFTAVFHNPNHIHRHAPVTKSYYPR